VRVQASRRPPPWRDVRVLRVVLQAGFLLVLVAIYYYLANNLVTNLQRQGIRTDFGYLDQPAGFAIPDSAFRSTQDVASAIAAGVKNTAIVSFVGIALALIVGVVVGVARLSTNWLVRRSAALYVESLRNIPVLLIIFFWYLAVLLRLPRIEVSVEWGGLIVLSNRGLWVPTVVESGNLSVFWWFLGAGLIAALVTGVWRTRRFDRTGEPHHRVIWGASILLGAALLGFFVGGRAFTFQVPGREGLVITGGLRMGPEYAALMFGLAIYTASHIAEIVRGSILSVAKGQAEAAMALGLSPFQRLRLVILPQAFRIMIPPLANQFLNLTKNSSLGVAIGYYEVTRVVRITISQGGPAPQSIVILMAIYLAFSLSISAVTNFINRQLRLETR
jgi:general L-amino acid transport system permease protein